MDRAIRWSPSSSPSTPTPTQDHHFLTVDVTGRSLKLNRVTSFDSGILHHDTVTTHTKVPAFRAFDWSPLDESLVAVGQASGDASILRLNSSSPNSQESYSFPIRSPRHCNAVAFSHHGLLAAGVDRTRHDFCLNVWDVNHRLAMKGSRAAGGVEPVKKLAASEPITSIKFFRDQPDTLVAGVKGQFVRVYDLREGPGSPSLQFPTRCVHNLAIDWLDENYIASCSSSQDPSVCIWDRRVGSRFVSSAVGPTQTPEAGQPGSALEFKNVLAPKSSIWSLRFSKTKRGCLGVLSNTGHFKTYDIAKEYLSEEYRSSVDETLGQGSFENYPEPVYTKYVRDVCSPFNHPSRGCNESERIVSFDFLNIGAPDQPSAITLSGNGQINLATLKPPSCPIGLSSQGVLVSGGPYDGEFKTVNPRSDESKVAEVVRSIRDRAQPGTNNQAGRKTLSSRQNREHFLSLGTEGHRLSAEDALTLLTVNKLRCQEGYLLDETRNKQILGDDPYLQDFWDWIKRARSDSADRSFVLNSLDMSYLGVYGVWDNDLGKSLKNRRIDNLEPVDVNDTIVGLVREQLDLPEMRSCQTQYPEHRRLCLRLCRAVQTESELEELVRSLPAEGQHTKAAALAVFNGNPKLAYSALRSHEPTQAHKLLAMAIAGAAKGDTDADWEDTCAEIAKELTDPYARGILALVSKGDWKSVIQETTLPLKYRVEVALRWLPDDDLTVFLREATAEAVRHGDIEGIVLTGLGHSTAMSLFQSYIKKFQDVQTPVLAMSHTVPRFLNDERSKAQFDSWRETYRQQINSWKMQLQRARFDVLSRKFAVTSDGRHLTAPPHQQISLTCNYCTRPLAQHDASQPADGGVIHPTTGNPLGAASMSGAVCPKCGRHMPRCGVCSLWLGSPDPMSKASMVTDGQERGPEMELVRRFVVFCVGCNHGFHAHHAREWFGRHRVCPVAECACICDR